MQQRLSIHMQNDICILVDHLCDQFDTVYMSSKWYFQSITQLVKTN